MYMTTGKDTTTMKMKKTTGEWRKIGQVLYTEPDYDDDFYYTLTSYLSFKAHLVYTFVEC